MGLWEKLMRIKQEATVPNNVPKAEPKTLKEELKTSRAAYQLWRTKIRKLVDEKVELNKIPTYDIWDYYNLYGLLIDSKSKSGYHLVTFYKNQTKNFAEMYPILEAEVHLLRLKNL